MASRLQEVLFEFIVQGNYVKVCAVDPVTRTEVSIVGDKRAGKEALQRLAMQKLQYVIDKNIEKETAAKHDPDLY